MTTKTKVYMKFGLCFLVCLLLYLGGTYFKDIIQSIFKVDIKVWIIEFILIGFMSLQNGIILEELNQIIFQKPEKIFVMLNYLILQLYFFSMILFCIALVGGNIFGVDNLLQKNILGINILVFGCYLLYIWYRKKKKQEKFGSVEIVKLFIGASIIFQSSIMELLFLAIYLLLLYLFTQMQNSIEFQIVFWLKVGIASTILAEIYILVTPITWLSKVILSITNIFIIYVGKKDWVYTSNRKKN